MLNLFKQGTIYLASGIEAAAAILIAIAAFEAELARMATVSG